MQIPANSLILFQGDSITDTGRARDAALPNESSALGRGYALMIAAELLAAQPADALRFYNRGISGNRIVDLYARIRPDTIHLRPDLLSVLIGVNDTWHGFGSDNGVPVAKYQRIYQDYLSEVRAELPLIRFVLCEPFVLRCGVVTDAWIAEMDERRAVVAGLAKEFSAVLVPFQSMFNDALNQAPAEYWVPDGVHPSPAGHHLMSQAWLNAVLS